MKPLIQIESLIKQLWHLFSASEGSIEAYCTDGSIDLTKSIFKKPATGLWMWRLPDARNSRRFFKYFPWWKNHRAKWKEEEKRVANNSKRDWKQTQHQKYTIQRQPSLGVYTYICIILYVSFHESIGLETSDKELMPHSSNTNSCDDINTPHSPPISCGWQ